jgi:hypothetical protein
MAEKFNGTNDRERKFMPEIVEKKRRIKRKL